ncbi:hypothetical protein N9O95_04855, partial [Alphaproteobacteria bacterium]|nr:hypothetical protein [Alphaproteobacteria bacterium]
MPYEQVSDGQMLLRLNTGEQLSLTSDQFVIVDGGLLLVVDELAQEAINQLPVMGAVRTQLLTEVQPVRSADGSVVEATDAKPLWSGDGDAPRLFEQVDIGRYELAQAIQGEGEIQNNLAANLTVGALGLFGLQRTPSLVNEGNGALNPPPDAIDPSASKQVTLLKDINATASTGSYPNPLTEFGGKLYFGADDGINGEELWVTDGTSSGTVMFKDINTTALGAGSGGFSLTEFGGKLYFSADDGINGEELWVTDGTSSGTFMLKDINTTALGAGSGVHSITEFGGKLYFS